MASLFETRRYLSDFEVPRVGHLFTDVLVVGSGIAGARAALAAAEDCDVIVVTKRAAADSATEMAQGGIAAASGPGDSSKRHVADTLAVGCGLNAPAAVELIVARAGERIDELIRWGAVFDTDSVENGDGLARTREGGHSVRRVLHASGDSTGRELSRVLLARLRGTGRIRLFEECFVIDLLTVDRCCVGAVTFHPRYGHQLIWAKQTILAGGGCGQVYRETTNPAVATGDTLAVAYRAGATLGDLEMMQFHPTTLYIAGASRALVSEAVRGEGAYLVDGAGNRFMKGAHPDAELAPRDVVSRAIVNHLREHGGTCVYLDVRHVGRDAFAARFPGITRRCSEFGIDVGSDLIPVNPGAHYMIGGVVTNLDGRTNIGGLLACGESACTGVHGANRLASNSLLEGLVFGQVAGRTAADTSKQVGAVSPSANVGSLNPESARTALDLADVRNSLRSVMWRSVGVLRDGDRLRETVEITEFWGRFVMDKTFDAVDGWETQNMLTVARLIAKSAELRPGCLGVHHRIDAEPNQTTQEPTHTLVTRSHDDPVFTRAPADFGLHT